MSALQSREIEFLPLGAIIQQFCTDGNNIVLGFPTQDDYVKYNTRYFGATIGRVANRIKDGIIKSPNGQEYQLSLHKGPNALHGGPVGWSKRIFDGPYEVQRNGKGALLFKYLSQDGEEQYPGTVEVRIWYIVDKENQMGVVKTTLTAEYEVEFEGDECEETVVNMTNHSYFNIGPGPNIAGTTARLFTDDYLPLDSAGIPVGKVVKFSREVTIPFELAATELHIDDIFVMEKDLSMIPLDTRTRPTEPAFQFYTGKNIHVPATDTSPEYMEGAGFCVEPSRYVNAINEPKWRDMVLLKNGQIFGCKNVYRTWKR